MSESDPQSGAGQREIAYRLFATEFDDADFSYSESDEERAPNYVVTPTGARVNRLFAVGVLTEVERVSDDVLRGRIVDQTGPFVVYAGQYQPDAQTFLERTEPPAFVAVTGKARTFEPDDGDRVYTSVRPETLSEVDADTRDRFTVRAAEMTLYRVGVMADALRRDERGDDLRSALASEGVDEGLAAGVALAIEHYGTTGSYLDAMRQIARQAAEVVAGERDEIEAQSVAPDADGPADLAALASLRDVALGTDDAGRESSEPPSPEPEAATATESTQATESAETPASTVETESSAESSESAASSEMASESVESGTASEPTETTASTDDTEPVAEASETTTGDSTTARDEGADADSPGDFEPGEFDIDDEKREEIEEEYGTEFQSGTDVEEPGEAGIEPETPAEEAAASTNGDTNSDVTSVDTDASVESAGDTQTEGGEPDSTASSTDTDTDAVTEPATSVDADADETEDSAATGDDAGGLPEDLSLEDAVLEAMRDLDDGDGADADAVVDSVVEAYGVDPEDIEDAVQEALMDGLCYEPQDDVLKPI